MTIETGKRNNVLDITKGLLIILVVIYHAMGKLKPDILVNLDNGLFNMIGSFFMLTFLIISGYLVYGKVTGKGWLRSHIIKWFIPLLLFSLIYWIVGYFAPSIIHFNGYYNVPLKDYLVFTLSNGFGGLVLWYVWCLISCYVLALIAERISLRFKIPLWVTITIILITLNVIPFTYLGVITTKWYSIFFFIGYLIKRYQDTKFVKITSKLTYACILLFPIAGYLLNWMVGYQYDGYLGIAYLPGMIANGHYSLIGIMVGMALLGSGFIYAISKLISKMPYIDKAFIYLGINSLGIYLIHIMFVGITPNVILSTSISLTIALVLYKMLSKWQITNKYLFGSEKIMLKQS